MLEKSPGKFLFFGVSLDGNDIPQNLCGLFVG